MVESADVSSWKSQLSNNELLHSMKWLITSMRIFGMVHFDTSVTSVGEKPVRRLTAAKVYQVVMLVLLILNQVRMALVFNSPNGISSQLFMDITFFCWMSTATTNAFAMSNACNCEKRFYNILSTWKVFNQQPSPEKLAYFKSRSRWYVLLVVFMFPCNIGFGVYAIETTSLFDAVLVPIKPGSEYINIAKSLYLVMHIVIAGYFSLMAAFVIFLANVAHYELKEFNTNFRKCITEDGGFDGQLEEERLKHQSICVFVEHADATVSLSVGVSFLICILEVLLILYNVIWWSDLHQHPLMMFIVVFWLMFAILYIAAVLIFCAYVNHEVSEIFCKLSKLIKV
eukprot:GHVO01007491.1.p1 GENE.GHVO01007491.1~~GHVO01007491.1.p1  ORF type:complete len:341 (+),score=19.77 GHVO01007491.1:430-1452(+)